MEDRKFTEETLTATVKKKNILLVIEYCLENKIEFVVSPATGNDEFLIGFVIKDLNEAVMLGMSLKDLKVDLNGLPAFVTVSNIKQGKKTAEPVTAKEKESKDELQHETEDATLQFDLESIS